MNTVFHKGGAYPYGKLRAKPTGVALQQFLGYQAANIYMTLYGNKYRFPEVVNTWYKLPYLTCCLVASSLYLLLKFSLLTEG